eukprot:g60402.t1
MAKGIKSKRTKELRRIKRAKGEALHAERVAESYEKIKAVIDKAKAEAEEAKAKAEAEKAVPMQDEDKQNTTAAADSAMAVDGNNKEKPGVTIKGLTIRKKKRSRSQTRTKGKIGEALKVFKKKGRTKKYKLGGKFFGV